MASWLIIQDSSRTHLRQERVEAVLEVHLRPLHVRARRPLIAAENGPDGHAAQEDGLARVVDGLLRLAMLSFGFGLSA